MFKFAVVVLFFSQLTPASNYTIEDLRVLARDNSYEEFFNHALDVRPSLRKQEWKSMVLKMGDSLGRSILAKSNIKRDDYLKIERLFAWPALKADDVFKVRRQEIGLRYLARCLQTSQPCWKELQSFWEKDKSSPEVAFGIAKILQQKGEGPYSAWTFLQVALKSPLSEFYCSKPFVMEALWKKLETDYKQLGMHGDLLTQIDRTIHPDCLTALISEAKKRLYQPKNSQDREFAFQVLKSQSKATALVSDFFYTIYLLDNPSKGELFNYSWNNLRKLGRSSSRRDLLLKEIKTLDPLPDNILKSLDNSKKKTILKHIQNHFPEYLDYYSTQCIKFYAGTGVFPKGNPTVNCQMLMNSEFASEVVDEFKIKKYQEAIKI